MKVLSAEEEPYAVSWCFGISLVKVSELEEKKMRRRWYLYAVLRFPLHVQ
jgi:hypothetical protein